MSPTTYLPPVDDVISVRTVIRIRSLMATHTIVCYVHRLRGPGFGGVATPSVEVMGAKHADNKLYMADHVRSENSTQDDVCATVSAVEAWIAGCNESVVAYGESGAGKTYSMHARDVAGTDGWHRGLVPRMLQALLHATKDAPVECVRSFVEMYNEKIHDVLGVRAGDPKNIRENTALNQVFVQDVVQVPVVHQIAPATQRPQLSVLRCVDLAECKKNASKEDKGRITHQQVVGVLFVVGVLSALVECLERALGGNAKTTCMATVSTEEKWMTDTLSKLQLVDRTTHITSRVKPNGTEGVERMVQSLQREVATLKESLANERHHVDAVVGPTTEVDMRKNVHNKSCSVGDANGVIPVASAVKLKHVINSQNEEGCADDAAMGGQVRTTQKILEPSNKFKRVDHGRSTPLQVDVAVATDEVMPPPNSPAWELLPSMEVAVDLFILGICVGRFFRTSSRAPVQYSVNRTGYA
ncbi:hypothetical protein H310_01858 [Aphanomyces invadans]|uniref:Kinesin motor domain-containing protein n=1 Tax=Aphanomyces invadans TaxID=157072 RepID=A0A024ULY1_9STRA|nr:hypothetical protein H310_01858 [Aphanomyces invadans]ETW07309.1 hypothetical protein H310_01858 [Aphanomyces invadans]|eukprot:XP_008863402.1 hypothetical protein H310_01858 [Aphanomyces invadans]